MLCSDLAGESAHKVELSSGSFNTDLLHTPEHLSTTQHRGWASEISGLEGDGPQTFDLKNESLIAAVSCRIIQMNMKAGRWTLILLQLSKTPVFEHMNQRLRNREKDFTINRLQCTFTQTLQTC